MSKTTRTPKPYKVINSDGNAYGGAIYTYEALRPTGELVRFRVERRSLGCSVWEFSRFLPYSNHDGRRRWILDDWSRDMRVGKARALSAALKKFCSIEH